MQVNVEEIKSLDVQMVSYAEAEVVIEIGESKVFIRGTPKRFRAFAKEFKQKLDCVFQDRGEGPG